MAFILILAFDFASLVYSNAPPALQTRASRAEIYSSGASLLEPYTQNIIRTHAKNGKRVLSQPGLEPPTPVSRPVLKL